MSEVDVGLLVDAGEVVERVVVVAGEAVAGAAAVGVDEGGDGGGFADGGEITINAERLQARSSSLWEPPGWVRMRFRDMGNWSGAQVASRSRDSQAGQNQADIPYRRRRLARGVLVVASA